ncbi:unnamed protein product [Rotaria socialis]
MVQVKKRFRHRSPPPRKLPVLPRPIQFQPPQLFDERPITQKTTSDFDTHVSNDKQHDPMTESNLVEPSLISIFSSTTDLENHDKQPLPSEINLSLRIDTSTAESMILLAMDDNVDGLLNKKHLPVFARFPFHVPLLSKPMDANVEDNIHRLRLRLIDAELDHQHLSTEEYIKRTRMFLFFINLVLGRKKKLSISSPTPTEYELNTVRPPSLLVHQQVVPRILSRQTSVSILSIATPSSPRHRLGLENDLPPNTDIERELEILRIEDSLNKNHQLNQSLTLSNFSYDSRSHLQPLNEKHVYSTSNVDDLIDSMARRHLAYRRLDAAIDRQRRTSRHHDPYPESMHSGRTTYRSPQRRDDPLVTNRSIRNLIEPDLNRLNTNNFNQRLRSRIDYYNRIQPDPDSLGIDQSVYTNAYSKLPPISSGYDSSRLNHLQAPLTPSFYDNKHDSHIHNRHHHHHQQQQAIPFSLSDAPEHLIDLPSDIYVTSRADALNTTQHHLQTPINRTLSVSKDNSLNALQHRSQTPLNRRISVTRDHILNTSQHDPQAPKYRPISVSKYNALNNSQTHKTPSISVWNNRQLNIENEKPLANLQHSRYEKISNSVVDHHEYTPEPNIQEKKKLKFRRNLFRKKAIGILFIIRLKHRAIKTREESKNHSSQPPNALIHKIRLQEIIVALHRVYLEPEGAIHSALFHAINNPISLDNALNRSTKTYSDAIGIIGTTLKTVISKITEFMPKEGVLGTEKDSAVSILIQDGNPFPEKYFWDCERKLLEFDNLKVINITKHRAKLLLIGIFLFRALITTLLLKPVKYRFILGHLTPNESISLKVLASVIFYIGRRAVGSKSQLLALPHEWQLSLYTDADIETIIQNSEINSIINTCEESLRMWCEEYIRRIDANFGKELRM